MPELPKAKNVPGPSPRFFFYFDAEGEARTAEGALTDAGYGVRVTPPDEVIAEWGVIATGTPDALDLVTAEEEGFIPLAEEFGAEYDGNEIPVG